MKAQTYSHAQKWPAIVEVDDGVWETLCEHCNEPLHGQSSAHVIASHAAHYVLKHSSSQTHLLNTSEIRTLASKYAADGIGGNLIAQTIPSMCAEIDRLRMRVAELETR